MSVKVSEAIRHAELSIQEAEEELHKVTELMGDQSALLDKIRVKRDGYTEEELAKI